MRILKIKTPESKLKTWIGGVPKGLAPVLLIIRIEKRQREPAVFRTIKPIPELLSRFKN